VRARLGYCDGVPDLWFFAGLAMGVVVTGFCAVGSFDRGVDSVRRRTWMVEFAARQRALVRSGSGLDTLVAGRHAHDTGVHQLDRLTGTIGPDLATSDADQERRMVRGAEVS